MTLLDKVNEFLALLRQIDTKKKCIYCGHEFNQKKALTVCGTCKDKVFSTDQRKMRRYIRNFNKNPSICPICRRNPINPVGNSKGGYCKECGKAQEY